MAFKMKNPSMAKMVKQAGSSMKMKSPAKMKVKESSMKMGNKKDSATKFNAKLKAASKAGKLSGEFKEAVDASPAKMKKPMKMKKAAMKMKSPMKKEEKEAKKSLTPNNDKRKAIRAKHSELVKKGTDSSIRKADALKRLNKAAFKK